MTSTFQNHNMPHDNKNGAERFDRTSPLPIVLIPLGGLGQRFVDAGHTKPKPLINALGQPILYWLLQSLNISYRNEATSNLSPALSTTGRSETNDVKIILIPYHPDLAHFRFEDQLRKDFPYLPFKFVPLSTNTRGAADTIKIALNSLLEDENHHDDCPIISLDGDNFYTIDILSLWKGKDCLVTFEDNGDKPIYSYVRVGPDHRVVEIKEKEKISYHACTGAYGFSSWHNLLSACERTMANEDNLQKNEFYISSVISLMIKDSSANFNEIMIPLETFVCLGTPLQLRAFCNDFPRRNATTGQVVVKPRRYCFDLDNTLVTFPTVQGDYSTVQPITYMIEYVRYLKRFGHTIIIYTARRMGTHKGNVGAACADIGLVTFQTLADFGIPYDEICFGKPVADCYVDDLGVSAHDDVEKCLGFYQTQVKPRVFNDISQPSTLQVIRKSQNNDQGNLADTGLEGEIYFYNHIPLSVKDCFPIMLHHDSKNSWYEVEQIVGSTVSNLFLNGELTPSMLSAIMGTLHRIHKATDFGHDPSSQKNIDIYVNYTKKIRSRYERHDYSQFPGSDEVYTELIEHLEAYERDGQGRLAVIHGDPVMSNIIINSHGKVKLIDMRGKLGDMLSIFGDETYDWAKLYQSIIGYDEILSGRSVRESYRQKLLKCFWDELIQLAPDISPSQVKLVTRSLLFSLLPLHYAEDEKEKQLGYYGLIKQCI